MNFDTPHIERRSESRTKAEAAVWASIGLEPEPFTPDTFIARLQEQVKTLPRYKKIQESLKEVPPERLFHEVFSAISRDADRAEETEDGPDDGVLVSSMRHGHLECAGRVLIASTYLSERGVPHATAQPPGHIMLLGRIDDDTMAYSDPNNGLYFTFPKEALRGYEGEDATSECVISDYVPRAKDVVEGDNAAFGRFLVSPPERSLSRSYLGNVQAALDGHAEFSNSGIAKDGPSADEVDAMKKERPDPVTDDWEGRIDVMKFEMAEQSAAVRETFAAIIRRKPEEAAFVTGAVSALDGLLGAQYPYLRHASDEAKVAWAKRMWQRVQADPEKLKRLLEDA